MNDSVQSNKFSLWKPFAVSLAILFLFSAVLPKLVEDWWSNEDYSHGLLMPFVVGYIIWSERNRLRQTSSEPYVKTGLVMIVLSIFLLLFAVLGSELFTQRIALVLVLVGVILYFFGAQVLRVLLVPFVLLLLSIPIPQILFNKIALPLQSLVSKMAGFLLTVLGIGPTRKGNVIEILPLGSDQIVGLEVVEACSGIRSLMTLAALAVILVYLTRERQPRSENGLFSFLKDLNFLRGAVLVVSAAPIALFTNTLRVTLTGVITYYWGREAAIGPGHDALGWITFAAGLVLLIVENELLRRFLHPRITSDTQCVDESPRRSSRIVPAPQVIVLFLVLLIGGLGINWFNRNGETPVERRPLAEMPRKIGEWWKVGGDTRFSIGTEEVLKASDYVMRSYYTVYGNKSNLYVGYYDSQRTGATYHSPLNCLPGSGWQLRGGQTLTLRTSSGRTLEVKRHIAEKGNQREVIVYWYQGRGRSTASEYTDKLYKIYDSIFMGRSDGAMVRIMTKVVDGNEAAADADALDFASNVADSLNSFVPE